MATAKNQHANLSHRNRLEKSLRTVAGRECRPITHMVEMINRKDHVEPIL